MKTVALSHRSGEIQTYPSTAMLFILQFHEAVPCALMNIHQPFSKMNYFGKTEEERRKKNASKIQEYVTFQAKKSLFKSVLVVVITQKK